MAIPSYTQIGQLAAAQLQGYNQWGQALVSLGQLAGQQGLQNQTQAAVYGYFGASSATATITTTSSNTGWYIVNAGTGGAGQYNPYASPSREITVTAGYKVNLPDGAVIDIDDKGSYKINDKDAKVVYQASRVREFNPFINASDLLERFIADVGKIDGVDQSNVLRVPVEGFINWLIRQAAQKDGDNMANLPTVEEALRLPAALPQLALVAA